MYKLLTAIIVCLALLAGCSSWNSSDGVGIYPPPPPPNPTVGSGNLGQANNGRLLPAGNPASAGVEGTFLVQGFTVLDENLNVTTPSIGSTKLMGRLLDPGDSILAAKAPGVDGSYELLTDAPVTNAKVQLEFWVLEDVDGDGQGNDLIVHTVPVQLVPGFVSQVNMTIKKGSVHDVSPVFDEGNASPSLPESSSVTVDVERLDGNGEYSEFFALLPDGSLYVDDNNDEFIEPGVDSFWSDLDRNGWADPEEQGYGDAGFTTWTYLEGKVLSVDTAAQTLHLFVNFAERVDLSGALHYTPTLVGQFVQVRKLSYTVLEGMLLPGGSGIGGLDSPDEIGFTDPFQITESLVGHTLIVQGLYEDNSISAELIFDLFHEPEFPTSGF